ncbi:MAG: 16S rRNA (cytosine(1402)-N(4))-methyltransferase RsmH [bacterium]|nr:16S rRNA (cytosine(1402)-N(4))-methyltransferase RsmH [bacterium]
MKEQVTCHRSVMPGEIVEAFSYLDNWSDPASFRLLDATFGGGGHTALLLERYPALTIVAFDRDEEALKRAPAVLGDNLSRVQLVNDSFGSVLERTEELFADSLAPDVPPFAGILADLGLSSDQLDNSERGFAFRSDGPLDMRMDRESELTAEQVLNGYNQRELVRVFATGGVGAHSAAMAKGVVAARPLQTTADLRKVCDAVWERGRRKGKRISQVVFQAVRIEVNDEVRSLESFLDGAKQLLAPGGKIAVICFHSLEDRIVAGRFRKWSKADDSASRLPMSGELPRYGAHLTARAMTAGSEENEMNPRARSAMLRIFQRGVSQREIVEKE